jgi:GTPase
MTKTVPEIVICGLKKSGKTTVYRQLIKNYSLNKKSSKINPLINYMGSLIKHNKNFYHLVDTPSFIISPQDEIEVALQDQIKELIENSDLIFWIVDSSQGINHQINSLNKYLKSLSTPKLLLLNKSDLVTEKYKISLFQKLKIENTYTFCNKDADWGRLMDKITGLIPNKIFDFPEAETENNLLGELKIAIFGPPNSGKSTLMNYLLEKNRSVVSPIKGTTQEPVRDWYNWKNWKLEITDTAGVEKKTVRRIEKNLINSDLVWVVIDATYPLTKQVAQIIHLAEENQKPLIIAVNKIDLITPEQKKFIELSIRDKIKSLKFVPIVFISASKKKGLGALLRYFKEIIEQSQKQFTKKQISESIESMLIKSPPAYRQGKRLKIYFAKYKPGLIYYFILFVNNPSLVHFSYQRYITNYLRRDLDLKYLPIKLIFKKSS